MIAIIAALIICLFEVGPLIKTRDWKQLITVVSILFMAIFFQISSNLGIMTPIYLLEKIFEPIGRAFFNKL